MIYGIDVHGTLAMRTGGDGIASSSLLPLLKPLMAAWVAKGQGVFIISGPPAPWIVRELTQLGLIEGVHYHGVYSMVDEIPVLFPNADLWPDPNKSGHFWTDESTWNKAKGAICAEYRIDVLIDDTAAYAEHVNPETAFVLVEASLLQQS